MANLLDLQYPDLKDAHFPSSLLSKCQHYHKTNVLFSYCCGLYCVQVALSLHNGCEKVDEVLQILLEYLEQIKPQINLGSEQDDAKSSNFLLRKALVLQLDKKYNRMVSILQSDGNDKQINFGQMVELLLDLAFMYDVLRGLFPLVDIKSVEEREELVSYIDDQEVEYRIHYCKTQASTILSVIKLGQNPLDYMSQLQLVPESRSTTEVDGITEDQIIDMMEKVLRIPSNELPDINTEGESENEENNEDLDSELEVKLERDDIDIDVKNQVETLKLDTSEKTSKGTGVLSLPLAPSTIENTTDKVEKDEKKGHNEQDKNNHVNQNSNFNSVSKPIPKFERHAPKDYSKRELEEMLEKDNSLELAIKDAKFAISALNYEDCDTAIEKLTRSIELIKRYQEITKEA